MRTVTLPQATDARERLFGSREFDGLYAKANLGQVLSVLHKSGWLVVGDTPYQPLFGLKAKTIDGKERTVVEGDVIAKAGIGNGYSLWLVEHHEWSFRLQCIHNGERFYHDLSMLVEHNNLFTILCHATDIVAAGNKLTCWSCEGTGEAPKQCGEGTGLMMSKCPTCHGVGEHNVEWKE